MFFSRIFKHATPEALPPIEGADAETSSKLTPPYFSGARVEEIRTSLGRVGVEDARVYHYKKYE